MMKGMKLKSMLKTIAFSCLFPMAAQAQLINLEPDGLVFKKADGLIIYSLREIPHHASDFFDYGSLDMFMPFDVEFTPGWRWSLGRFSGTRKPTSMSVNVEQEARMWIGPHTMQATYDANGRILSYKSGHGSVSYTFSYDGSLQKTQQSFRQDGYRVDAFIGRVQSTLNGKPQFVVGDQAQVSYTYDEKLRVSEAMFSFTDGDRFDVEGNMDIATIVFSYKYDNADNIIEIAASFPNAQKKGRSVTMSYDSQNRLVEQIEKYADTGSRRYTYQYDDQGAVVREEEYNYETSSTLTSKYATKYDIQRDTKGQIISLHGMSMSHMYQTDWAVNDTWNENLYITYDYDQYGNWTTLQTYSGKGASTPTGIVKRVLEYGGGATTGSSDAAASAPSFRTLDNGTISTYYRIGEIISKGDYKEAEKETDQFIKTDDTGKSLHLLAVLLHYEGKYAECIEVAKKAIAKLKEGQYDYRGAVNIAESAYIKPYIDYRNAYNEPGHDLQTLNKLRKQLIEGLEDISKIDPYNLGNWKEHLMKYYQEAIDATDNTSYYREKLEALKTTGKIKES